MLNKVLSSILSMRALSATILLLSALAGSGQCYADVYVYTDDSGVMHFTNAPTDERFALLVAVVEEVGPGNRAQAAPEKGRVVDFAPIVAEAAGEAGLEPALVHAIITAESAYNPKAVSRAGAQGLMQLMPQTAKRYAVKDAFDPQDNIRGGTRYLRDLLSLFEGSVELAVAAYNAGENAVIRHGRQIPPFRETRSYVPKVLQLYQRYKAVL